MDCAPDAKMVTVPFTFVNDTKRTLTIERYDAACSCVSAQVKGGKLVYQPGEKGEMLVEFALGSFSGEVEKAVMLWTTEDAEDAPSSILTVAIKIPKLFEVSPRSVFWEQGGSKETKLIKLTVHHTKPIKILSHAATSDQFDYEVKTIREGWEYQLLVTPKDVSKPAYGMIKLMTDSTIPRYQRQRAFVVIKKAKSK